MGSKIAILADTHAGVRNDNPYMLENFKQSCRWFFDTIRSQHYKVDAIVHLGDVFDRHKYINFVTAKAVREELFEPAMHWPLHVILGNHDQYYKNTHEVNSLREMLPYERDYGEPLIVYDRPTHLYVGGRSIIIVPWISDSNREETENILNTHGNQSIVFGHLELKGFEMYKNTPPMTHGDDHSMYQQYAGVYSGHFHKKSGKDNVHYVGAFGEYTWSDHKCPRGFSILDVDTLELEFFENPHTMFEQIIYNDMDVDPTVYQTNDYSYLKGKYVRVLVEKRNDAYSFDVMMDHIHSSEPADVVIVEYNNIFTYENDIDDDLHVSEDTPSILDNYIENTSNLSVEKDVIKNYMRDLYKDAISMNATVE